MMNISSRFISVALLVALSILFIEPPFHPLSAAVCAPDSPSVKSPSVETRYAVQVAGCLHEKTARSIAEELRGRGYEPEILVVGGREWYLVVLGTYDDSREALEAVAAFESAEQVTPLVISFDNERTKRLGQAVTSQEPPLPGGAGSQEVHVHAGEPGVAAALPEEDIPDESTEFSDDGGEGACDETFSEQIDDEAAEEEEYSEEEDWEDTDEGEWEDWEEDAASEGGPFIEYTYSGFVEVESLFSTRDNQDFGEANKKNELRGRLEMRIGPDNLYLFAVSDLYLSLVYLNEEGRDDYVYSGDRTVARNLRMSSRESEVRFDELYLNYGEGNYRIRVGNQIYGWGTADAFNSTAYFNPYDLRELLFKDDDENRLGVPSVSGMFFLEDSTLEVVFVPVHVPMVIAPEGNFWSVVIDDYFYPIKIDEPRGMPVTGRNCGIGTRLSQSIMGLDFSFSLYRGPDQEPVFIPRRTILAPGEPMTVLVEPQYYTVNMVGVDFTTTLGDFVIQTEAAYSPDKRGLVKQDLKDYENLKFPFEVRKSNYLSYAMGFNYFIPLRRIFEQHEGESVFTFEWAQARYFDDDLYVPFLTDLITCRYEDSFFGGRVNTKLTGIFETRNGGAIFWPEVGYDFQNGWTIHLSYAGIRGRGPLGIENNSLFYYFEDNDMVMGRIRYEFYGE